MVIYDDIYNAAFIDELEKLSGCKSHKGVKPKKTKPIEKVAGRYETILERAGTPLVAGLMGLGLGGSVFGTIAQKKIEDITPEFAKKMEQSSASVRDLRKKVKELHPEVSVITKKKELKKMKDVNVLRKILLGMFTPIEENALYSSSKKSPIVILPDTGKINKYVLGHELGHHRSYKELQDKGLLTKIKRHFEPDLKEEHRAWELSPFAGQKREEKIKELALQTYTEADKAGKRARATALAVAAPTAVVVNKDLIVDAVKKLKKIVKK